MKNALISLITLGFVVVLVLVFVDSNNNQVINEKMNPQLQGVEPDNSSDVADNAEKTPVTEEETNPSSEEPAKRSIEQNKNIVENSEVIDEKPDVTEPSAQPETPSPAPETQQPSNTQPAPTPDSSGVESGDYMSQVEQLIFQAVNSERSKAGVAPLNYNNTMQNYARIKSKDMGTNNYFSHEDQRGNLITEQMKADGVSYNAWGENIAYIGGVTDPQALANQFMTNWMNSTGHRENILSTNFNGIGVGVYQSGSKVYATQEFHR